MCAIALDGTRAVMVVDGLSSTGFCEWLLAPVFYPGDLVVMDNLSSHKSASVRSAIEAAGAEVVLRPPYSPDPNLIKTGFSKLKQLIRSQRPGTFPKIVDATRNALEFLQQHEIQACYEH